MYVATIKPLKATANKLAMPFYANLAFFDMPFLLCKKEVTTDYVEALT